MNNTGQMAFCRTFRYLAVLLWIALGLFPGLARAATYYVDFAGGLDVNDGASTSTPWQHCPGDSLVTGIPAKTALKPGDVVVFKGGVDYQSTIQIINSGTAESPITFDGNTQDTFGTGKATLNGGNVNNPNRQYGFQAAASYGYRTAHAIQYSNVVIRGFVFTRFGGHGTDNPANITWNCSTEPSTVNGYGISLSAADHFYIGSCLFTNLGDWTNAPYMSANFQSGHGIRLEQYNQNITITNNEFTRVGNTAIAIVPAYPKDWATNIWIGSNNIHNYIQWGILIAPSSGCSNTIVNSISITNNAIHDMWEYSQNGWLGCPGEWPHTDGIFCFLGYSPYPTYGATLGTVASPLIIANNSFYCDQNYTNNGGTANIYISGYGGRVLIYNNTFANVLNMGEGSVYLLGAYDLAANACTMNDYEVYNNSFFDQTFGVYVQSYSQAKALTNGTVKVANNVFYHSTVSNFGLPIVFGADAWSRPTLLDYNRYVTIRTDQTIGTSWGGSATVYNTFAQLRALGFETHGSYGDPKYFDISAGLGLRTSLNDLHLQSNSPLIGVGLNLSSIFTLDKDGKQRPSVGSWDVGAFQYSTTSSTAFRPTPPSGLRVSGTGF